MRTDEFSAFHPAVNLIWFLAVLGCTMVYTHPVMLLISLCCAVGYAACLGGKRAIRSLAAVLVPGAGLAILLGPVFNHEGATILCWLPNGNPLTKEAILYGCAAALMLCASVVWFYCLSRVFTSDKFLWLFGRVVPALSLVLSMALRFVPRFTARMRAVSAARTAAGCGAGQGMLSKLRHGITVFSIVVTWALENAIDTADSMKSRGYGLPGRTAFSVYRWTRRDGAALLVALYCLGYVVVGSAFGGIYWQYYPLVLGEWATPFAWSIFFAYLALCATPLYINGREAVKWKYIRSEI